MTIRISTAAACIALLVAASACRSTAAREVAEGDQYAHQQQFAEAAIKYRRALQQSPNDADAYAGLVQAYRAAGLTADAIAACRAWIDAVPDDARATALLADLLPAPKAAASPDAASLVATARSALAAHQTHEAIDYAQRALATDATLLEANGLLAQALIDERRFDEADTVLRAAITRHPRVIELRLALALLDQWRGRSTAAQDEFEQLLALDPTQPVAANNLAWMYAESGQHLDEAIRLARVGVEGLPASADPLDTLGWAYLKAGRGAMAVTPLEKAVAMAPQNPSFRLHLAEAYAAAQQRDRARSMAESVIAGDPTPPRLP